MRLCIVKIILFVLISQTCFGEQLSSEHIAELLYAASQQYKTVDIEFEREGYSNINGTMELDHRGNIVYRSTFDKVYYSHEGEHFHYGGTKENSIRTADKIAVTPQYSKQLAWGDNTKAYEGLVTRNSLEDVMLGTPLEFLFEIFETYDQNSLASKIVDVHKNKDGNYIIKVERNKKMGLYVDITINPQYNFIPSKYEFTRNGKVGYNTEFADFKEVCPGIWLPFAYSYTHPGEATAKLKITKARVNVSLTDSEMDFAFPSGAYVIDRIANMEYTVGEGLGDTDTLEDGLADIGDNTSSDHERNLNFKTTETSVSDEQLQSAYEKSKILSGSDNIQEAESPKRLFGAICLIVFLSVIITVIVVCKKRRQ